MNKTKWIIFAVVVVAIFGGIIWVNKSNQKQFTGDASKVITTGAISDHVFGKKDSKVVLIEYGDYQCPACGAMYQPTKDLVNKYQDKIAFIFRNFPLTNIHPNALAAASAAEAAGLQGKYFEMHDLLYENQDAWKDAPLDKREEVFVGYARMLGLDENKFKTDLSSKDISDKIARDRSAGNNIGVEGTPTFVINGQKLEGQASVDIDAITQKVTDAIAQAYPSSNTSQNASSSSKQQQ